MRPNAIRIKEDIYTKLYEFDGGAYYVNKNVSWAKSWIALLDDGTLQILINGIHKIYKTDYTIID